MLENERSDIDRRSGEDRRKELYSREDNFRYFSIGESERRAWRERRSEHERRKGWLRVNKWCSCWWDMWPILRAPPESRSLINPLQQEQCSPHGKQPEPVSTVERAWDLCVSFTNRFAQINWSPYETGDTWRLHRALRLIPQLSERIFPDCQMPLSHKGFKVPSSLFIILL